MGTRADKTESRTKWHTIGALAGIAGVLAILIGVTFVVELTELTEGIVGPAKAVSFRGSDGTLITLGDNPIVQTYPNSLDDIRISYSIGTSGATISISNVSPDMVEEPEFGRLVTKATSHLRNGVQSIMTGQ